MAGYNRRYASHPLNAMLNYAYAVLESQVCIATVSQGLDPAIGYLHASSPGRVALVYDLMEPLRPHVDLLMLEFVCSHTFTSSDFTLGADGVCRLHPQLARKALARLAVDDRVMQKVVGGFVQALKEQSS